MALAAKPLYNTDSRSGKRLIASRRRTCKADLRSSFCCKERLFLCSVWTRVWWHDKSVCVYVLWPRTLSRPKKVFFPKPFAKSLTHSCKRGFDEHWLQRRYSKHNIYLGNRLISSHAGWLPALLMFIESHAVGFGSVLLICYLYSDMFTPYQGTTRTLLSLYRVYIVRKPLLCLKNDWNQDCLCCKSSHRRPLLVCLVNRNFGLDCWDVCTV